MIYLLLIDDEADKRKFVIIYEQYKHLMLKVASDVLGDYHEAEDAVHEAFIKVAKNMKQIGRPEAEKTKRYLIITAKRTAIDIYRRKRLKRRMETYSDNPEKYKKSCTYIDDEAEAVLSVLRLLPDIYKEVFFLKYSSHMKNKDIAKILFVSESTVRQRLARGKRILQERLNGIER